MENPSEETISESASGAKLQNLIDEIRAQSPGRILPLKIILNIEGSVELPNFLNKLIQDKTQEPGMNTSYFEFYNSQLKGISRFF